MTGFDNDGAYWDGLTDGIHDTGPIGDIDIGPFGVSETWARGYRTGREIAYRLGMHIKEHPPK